MRRILMVSVVGVLLTASPALATDDSSAATVAPVMAAGAAAIAQPADITTAADWAPRPQSARRPLALPSLYAMSAMLQGYDAYSTLTVLKNGGSEANPLMKGVTKSPVVFIGLKAGTTALSIMAAERMWKNHNRLGAVLTMVASNGFMAIVARHNASVMARVK